MKKHFMTTFGAACVAVSLMALSAGASVEAKAAADLLKISSMSVQADSAVATAEGADAVAKANANATAVKDAVAKAQELSKQLEAAVKAEDTEKADDLAAQLSLLVAKTESMLTGKPMQEKQQVAKEEQEQNLQTFDPPNIYANASQSDLVKETNKGFFGNFWATIGSGDKSVTPK